MNKKVRNMLLFSASVSLCYAAALVFLALSGNFYKGMQNFYPAWFDSNLGLICGIFALGWLLNPKRLVTEPVGMGLAIIAPGYFHLFFGKPLMQGPGGDTEFSALIAAGLTTVSTAYLFYALLMLVLQKKKGHDRQSRGSDSGQ